MVISIISDQNLTIDEIISSINREEVYVSAYRIWFEKFYVKLENQMIVINIFDESITKRENLFKVLDNIISKQGDETFIRIEKENEITQFFYDKTKCLVDYL